MLQLLSLLMVVHGTQIRSIDVTAESKAVQVPSVTGFVDARGLRLMVAVTVIAVTIVLLVARSVFSRAVGNSLSSTRTVAVQAPVTCKWMYAEHGFCALTQCRH